MAGEGSARDDDYVKVIKHGDQAIYIIGTAHISEQSCEDIRELIEEIQPSVVMVELCDARLQRLVNNSSGALNMTFQDIMKQYRNGNMSFFSAVFAYYMGSYAKHASVPVGSDFRTAYEEAKKINAPVVCIDRLSTTTMHRGWSGFSIGERFRICAGLLISSLVPPSVERIKLMVENTRSITQSQENVVDLNRFFPWMQECFVHERDMYLAIKMRETVESCKGDMVAVVGARHILGIIDQWSNTDNAEWRKNKIAELDQVPGSAQLPMKDFRKYVNERKAVLKTQRRFMTSSARSVPIYTRLVSAVARRARLVGPIVSSGMLAFAILRKESL